MGPRVFRHAAATLFGPGIVARVFKARYRSASFLDDDILELPTDRVRQRSVA